MNVLQQFLIQKLQEVLDANGELVDVLISGRYDEGPSEEEVIEGIAYNHQVIQGMINIIETHFAHEVS